VWDSFLLFPGEQRGILGNLEGCDGETKGDLATNHAVTSHFPHRGPRDPANCSLVRMTIFMGQCIEKASRNLLLANDRS